MLLTIFLVLLAVYWIVVSYLAYTSVTKSFKKYNDFKTIEEKPEWAALFRLDAHLWDKRAIIIGCFTLAPIRLMVLFLYVFIFFLFALIGIIRGKFSKRIQKIIHIYTKIFSHFLKIFVIDIQQQYDYTQPITTPIIISNHVAWFDIFYIILRFFPISFISKASVRQYPLIGTMSKSINCIFIQRGNDQMRKKVTDQIKERIDQFNKKQEQAFPLAIFPEGTTSNGKGILRFKSGAFYNLSPITALLLRYQCKNFGMGLDQITQSDHFFLMITQKPKLIVRRLMLKPLDNQTADQYRERSQKQIAQNLNIVSTTAGFRDKMQLQKIRKQQKQQKQKKTNKND